MPQDSEITTFQFLEHIQSEFLKQMGNGSGARYDTRRIINFFNDTASLHIIDPKTSNGNNGDHPLAILSLQQVAREEEKPTFAVNYQIEPQNRLKKIIVVLADTPSMKQESSRILGMLKRDIEGNGAPQRPQATPAPSAQPVAAVENIELPDAASESLDVDSILSSATEAVAPSEENFTQDLASEGTSVLNLDELTGGGSSSSDASSLRRRRRERS